MAKHIEGGRPRTASERWAIEFLKKNLPDDDLLISNIDITERNGRRLELDALLIGKWAVHVLEFKGWTGRIVAGEHLWDIGNGMQERSPLDLTGHKARVLAGRLKERVTGRMHIPWCQAAVFLTGAQGRNIELVREPNAGQVAGPEDIVERLTDPEYVGSRYRDPITPAQRRFVLEALGGLGRLSQVADRIQGFELGDVISSNGPYEVRVATYSHGDFERRFLIRIVDRSADPDGGLASWFENRLVDEFRLLQELSGVAGIPYAAPLIEDDERIALAVAIPEGRMLADLDPADIPVERRIGLLRALARILRDVHVRGAVHGGIDASTIVVSEQDEVQLADFAAAPSDAAHGRLPGPEDDIRALASIFRPWFRTVTAEEEQAVSGIRAWLDAVTEQEAGEGPDLVELFAVLRTADADAGPRAATETEAPFELEEGATLRDTFRLEAELGESASGSTWRAMHVRGRYPVALQFTGGPVVDEQAVRQRFAEIANVQHPLVARAFDLRQVPGDDRFYLVAEWHEGPALTDVIEEGRKVEIDRGIRWFRDALSALEAVHLADLAHGNICPDALVIADDRPRLVEFALRPDSVSGGGVPYSPPEAAVGGANRSVDLYGIVASFVHLWTGAPPVSRQGVARTLGEIAEQIPKGIPGSLRDGILGILDRRELPDPGRYLEFFELNDLARPMTELPEEFRSEWGISKGHQERVAIFLINEFVGNPNAKARKRSSVVAGSLALTNVRANRTLRNAANSAISALISKGVIEKPRKRGGAVRPSASFIDSWQTLER
ncbi:hypothetical protein HFP89_08075 [Wenzhouxiangella sp. XN79A]|uniref:NERD domain-containing protein kinase family protein n=1 Tax=Wenzhouxiangella sp. XN79A TaxID=2724193 RepID=UPI00144AE296|nr:NERD domain-containing protein kinase family protein [Wenzhouxiangella sp. XN79A]NKI35121.1 hypothetical protein [Wenzhouxiangella sp. XN79A]